MFTLWIQPQPHTTHIVQAIGYKRGLTVLVEVDYVDTFAILQKVWRKHCWQWLVNEHGLYRIR